MIRQQTIRARDKLVSKMSVTGELLRGTLLERTVRHKSGCPKCARGEGHQPILADARVRSACAVPALTTTAFRLIGSPSVSVSQRR
jgi:hypothetical protein